MASEDAPVSAIGAGAAKSVLAVVPTSEAPFPVVLAGPLARRPAEQAAVAPTQAAPQSTVSALAPVAVLPVQGLPFQPPLTAVLRPTASLSLFPAVSRKGLRGEIPWKGNVALDHEVALRTWAGQHYKKAAAEMEISIAAFLSRRSRLELPRMARNEWVEVFNKDWAPSMIEAFGYKKVQCRAYKQRGVEFYFWCKKTEKRLFSKLARSKAWFREAEAAASYGF